MKIALTDLGENPYANFLQSIRSSETRRMYTRNLKKFLELIPNGIFLEYLHESPKSRDVEDLTFSFIKLAKKEIIITKQSPKSYCS